LTTSEHERISPIPNPGDQAMASQKFVAHDESKMDNAEKLAIVTYPRGSWKWQDAYRVVAYRLHKTRDGRWIWKYHHQVRGKSSWAQLKRSGWTNQPKIKIGGLHNSLITDPELVYIDNSEYELQATIYHMS
jgi:hypothetical protein